MEIKIVELVKLCVFSETHCTSAAGHGKLTKTCSLLLHRVHKCIRLCRDALISQVCIHQECKLPLSQHHVCTTICKHFRGQCANEESWVLRGCWDPLRLYNDLQFRVYDDLQLRVYDDLQLKMYDALQLRAYDKNLTPQLTRSSAPSRSIASVRGPRPSCSSFAISSWISCASPPGAYRCWWAACARPHLS